MSERIQAPGHLTTTPPQAIPVILSPDLPTPRAPVGEAVLLNEAGVLVTTARFASEGSTYAMANVTSVKPQSEPRQDRAFVVVGAWIVTSIIACAVIQDCGGGAIAVILLFALASIAAALCGHWHYVVLTTAGGEQRVLRTDDQTFASRIIQAIERAIVARG